MEYTSRSENLPHQFLKIYFYLSLALMIFSMIIGWRIILERFNYILQYVFSILGFIAFFGYVHDKRIFTRLTWVALAALFFAWELGCYLFLYRPLASALPGLVMLLPKCWCIALYPFITMELDNEKRLSNIRKRDFYVSKFKVVFVIFAVLASLAVLLRIFNYTAMYLL